MSQIRRATVPRPGPSIAAGRTRNVSKSGLRSMSDSSMRAKPMIEEPSNMISPSRAFSNWERGTSTFLICPRMSENWSLRKLTSSSFSRARTSSIGVAIASLRRSARCAGSGAPRHRQKRTAANAKSSTTDVRSELAARHAGARPAPDDPHAALTQGERRARDAGSALTAPQAETRMHATAASRTTPSKGGRTSMKRALCVLAVALVGLAMAQPPVSRVGTLMSYTGALAEFGPAINNGATLAADQINAAATAVFGGPLIEIVTEDDGTNPSQGTDRARKLVNTDGVVAIV